MMAETLKILFEDNHLLVLDKPPLIATMGVSDDEPSLLKHAKEYIRRKYNKPGNVYLGVVSRLDAFVSGVIVFARTSKSASRLSEQIRSGKIKKTYWAIVPNRLKQPSGSLRHYVYKDDARRRMFATDQPAADRKHATLSYQTLATAAGKALLEIDLETGRKHQIRVQFSHVGCPIVGDRKYDSDVAFNKGIALHCRSLHFEHPTQKTRITVKSDPPGWWNLASFGIS